MQGSSLSLYRAASMSGLEERLARYRDLIDDWPAFLEACRAPLPTVVWVNPWRDCPRPPRETLEARGLRVEPLGWIEGAYRVEGLDKPGHTLEFTTGAMHVQEEVSLAPPVALGARPGERVLDLCAAPGGKTARIAITMENRGTLVANDVRIHRLRALRANLERLGVLNVAVTHCDGIRFPLGAGPFDRILLDVPCSCEGNVRDTPGAAGRAESGPVAGRAGLQATLLGRAWKLLSPGGLLVYSTCTFAPEENEVVLDHVLGDDARIEPTEIGGLAAAPGVTGWNGAELRADCARLARYWPHLNDTGGFTIARVRKIARKALS